MKAAPGKGKWRLKGRGRRLGCGVKGGFLKWHHGLTRPCRYCGQSTVAIVQDYAWDDILRFLPQERYSTPLEEGEIGVIHKVRFI